MSERRVVQVGLGTAAGFVADAVRDLGGVEIVGACDPLGARARNASRVDCPVVSDVAGLRRLSFDTAIVSVPTPHHHAAVLELIADPPVCLRSVFVEKPLATNQRNHEELVRTANARRVELRTMLHTAYAPEVEWAASRADWLVSEHGPITCIECEFRDAYGRDAGKQLSLAGAWLDSGINALSVIGRFSPLLGVAQVTGDAVLDCEIEVDLPGAKALVRTSWLAEVGAKTTTFAFSSGALMRLDHTRGAATSLGGSGIEAVGDRRFPRTSLSERYVPMLRDLFDGDAPAQAVTREHAIHRVLYEALGYLEAQQA